MNKHVPCLFVVALVTLQMSAAAYGAGELAYLLRTESDIKQSDLARLGNAVLAKELPVADRSRNLAIIGVVRMETTPRALHLAAANIDDIPQALLPASVRNLSLIPDPPDETTFARLKLTETQQKALRSCKLDKCRMKLPVHLINTLTALPYRWPDHAETFSRTYRSALVDMVSSYRERGDDALWVYRDKADALHAATGYQTALQSISSAPQLVPEVIRYLQEYPAPPPEGALADFMFWSVLDFGHRPTLTVDHALSIRPDNPQLQYLFAIKTIYANHYFGGRASFGALLEEDALGVPGRYFVLVEHLSFDGKLNRLLRGVVGRGIVADVENRLELVRALAARAAPPG